MPCPHVRSRSGPSCPQGWKTELADIDGAEAQWAKVVEVAELAERLGYDSIWLYDHFHNVPRPAHEAVFECWTTLAALSQRTSRVRLGQMVGCAPYRNPGLLAKITSNIDVMSGGRLDWGIGAGWYEHEFRGYGYDFLPPKDRIAAAGRDRRDRAVDVDRARHVVRRRRTSSSTAPSATPSRCRQPAPADPHRWQRRAAARCGSSPGWPTGRTSAATPRSSRTSATCCAGTATRSGATTTRSRRPGRPTSSCARPRPRCGRSAERNVSASRSTAGRPATWWARRSR